MSALHDLAEAAGLQREWRDAMGEDQLTSDDALAAVLAALGYPHGEADGLERARADAGGGFLSADVGQPVDLPRGWTDAELVLEDGASRRIASGFRVDLVGYHLLVRGDAAVRLAIAPARCFSVADAVGGERRVWAAAAQVPSLRGPRATPYGDLGTLADTARALSRMGAQGLAISPTHALFPADPGRYSPYAPSSRLFHNVWLGDPGLAGAPSAADAGGELIDWSSAAPARMAQLRAAWAGAAEGVRDAVARFREAGGGELERHARFDALHERFFRETGAGGWRGWPDAFRDPESDAVHRFATDRADDVAFYAFCQWLAAESLHAAQKAAQGAGMEIGLIADLAVGVDSGGSQAWSRPGDLLTGLSIGAPPDLLGPDGQNWGITAFAPAALRRTGFDAFIATLRAAIDTAGGIRIDHALGLSRLWVVPEGESAKDGVYLTMPMGDLLRVITIESVRNRAIVIGEDLGTVPGGLREAMDARAMLGMRVLQFERDEDGRFIPPGEYHRATAAMTGTHDLPTIRGWWRGRDVDWAWDLHRTSRAPDKSHDLGARERDKVEFWRAMTEADATDRPEPEPWDADPVIDAAVTYVGEAASVLAIVPMEDLVAEVEQPNLPGTTDEHPNWRRRLPEPTEALLGRPPVARRIALLNEARDKPE